MITEAKFNEDIAKYDKMEKRGSFYKMAVNLLNNGFEMEAYFLILATWNFARFRYAVNDFDIENFKEKMKELNPYFGKLKTEDFRTIEFDKYREDIKKIFHTLSSIKGIEYTGAAKIMHLKNQSVFVMWDGSIKGEKTTQDYNKLQIVQDGQWKLEYYENSPESYIQFLKDMQGLFNHIHFQSNEKTFAKAIDEFNYVNITLPLQEIADKKKEMKR